MIELLAILATWRITTLLVRENGPFEVFAKFRHLMGVRYDQYSHCIGRGLAAVLCCIWCSSLWISAVVAVAIGYWRGDHWLVGILDWLAFSGGAILVEKLVNG